MTLTADAPLTRILGDLSELSLAAGVKIYEGAMLGDNGSGYGRPLVAGDPFRGHAVEYCDNTGGIAGAVAVKRLRGRYRLEVTISGVLITDIGKDVYATNEETLILTAGTNTRVGVVDRWVTTDICIVEFQTVGHISTRLNLALTTAVSGEENIHKTNLIFAGAGGPKRGLYSIGEIKGAGNSLYGMWKFRTYLSAAADAAVHTICANLHFKAGAELIDSGEYASAPLYVTLETDGDAEPDLSGGSLAAIYVGYYVDEAGGEPANAYVIHINSAVSKGSFDGLLIAQNAEDINLTVKAGSASTHGIPVKIAGTTRYIMLCA